VLEVNCHAEYLLIGRWCYKSNSRRYKSLYCDSRH